MWNYKNQTRGNMEFPTLASEVSGGSGGRGGPTFGLSSHPTPCTCSQATPVPFSLPWGSKWGGTALLFPRGWGVGPGGCEGAACEDQGSPASAQRPCPGLMLRGASQEI